VLDVLLILLLQRYGIRKLETIIVAFVLIIGVCFVMELFLAQPDWAAATGGFVPRLDGASLYIAIGILGATMTSHNLYVYSALVQTRQIVPTHTAKRQSLRYNGWHPAPRSRDV